MFLTGRVKWYDQRKGYGFVESAKGDIFIHYTAFKEADLKIDHDDLVSFDAVSGEKGLKAQNITKTG